MEKTENRWGSARPNEQLSQLGEDIRMGLIVGLAYVALFGSAVTVGILYGWLWGAAVGLGLVAAAGSILARRFRWW